jgi:hypothetical protein
VEDLPESPPLDFPHAERHARPFVAEDSTLQASATGHDEWNDLYLQSLLENWQDQNLMGQTLHDVDVLGSMVDASMGFDWSSWNGRAVIHP